MPRVRRKHSLEFKDEAVKLVRGGGKLTQVARDLGVAPAVLSRWVNSAEEAARPGAISTKEREELQRLRREVEVLREEREILKKAAAFFAKESK